MNYPKNTECACCKNKTDKLPADQIRRTGNQNNIYKITYGGAKKEEKKGRTCFKYENQNCNVAGNNIVQLNGISQEDCQKRCDNTAGCKGIEYFNEERAKDPNFRRTMHATHKPGDCNLSSSTNTSSCDKRWNMDLWIKKEGPCQQ